MATKKETFERILSESFSNENFTLFIREMLTGITLVDPDHDKPEYSNFSYYVKSHRHIGTYESEEGDKIAVFSVCLNKDESVERARSMQRNFVKTLLENSGCAGALVAFYTNGELLKWRLSFVRLDYEFASGKVKEKLTPAKRYSYLVGSGEPCNTAKQQLFGIFENDNARPGLDALEESFSVEKVTKEFYDLYSEKYQQLREYLESNQEFVAEANFRGFSSEQFAKKLMGQIVFLYFIQKKGWLGVNAIPVTMTEKEYKNAFFARGSKSREVVAAVYKQQDDGTYKIDITSLKNLPDEDEDFLAGIVHGSPWGSGPKDFMRRTFEGCVAAGKNYFDDYLEPLFYTGLNLNRGENGYYPPLHRRIPFLNGGLFEQLDNYEWEHNNFAIPNEIFSNRAEKGERDADGILDIFDRYNFTMSEDEPMEREVAIDPEMLGKVFENLLDVKDRKSKGAFYTPRPIVHYMCQETLISYLSTKMNISVDDIREVVLYGELMKDEDTKKTLKITGSDGKNHYVIDKNKDLLIPQSLFSFKNNVNRLSEMDDLLKTVCVADLAVGSGAFPVGMLSEIVRLREMITEYLSVEMTGFQKKSFISYGRKRYDLKVETIKNCIYACDIEPSAVDIAKLRLWLSIVIDDEITSAPNNGEFEAHSKPRQLPNLECNIICGNSLVDEFNGRRLISESTVLNNVSNNSQVNMYQYSVEPMLVKLIDLQDKLFFEKNHDEKEALKKQIQDLYDNIIFSQGLGEESIEEYKRFAYMDSKPFILWALSFPRVFRENGGFDIVIGNPPYLKEIDYKDIFKPVLETEFGREYGEGKMNFWYFFFHKGVNLLNNNGTISFIAPNYFVAGSGASKLNKRFVNDLSLRAYIDFNKTKVFDTADVQCMIFICSKNAQRRPFNAYLFKHKVDREEIGKYINTLNSSSEISVIKVDNQEAILSEDGKINFANAKFADLLEKIEKKRSLRKIFKATQGIVENPSCLNNKNIASVEATGVDVSNYSAGDEVFVISKENIDTLHLTSEEKAFLREYHDPSDIRRYTCSDTFEKYLLYVCRDNVEDIEKYPNIKAHLIKYKPFMEMRRETQKGTIKWFQLHWPRKEEIFKGEKVVYPQMGAKPTFAYSDKPFYFNMSANLVYACVDGISLKAMTAVLNSNLAHFYLLHRAKNRGIGLDIAVTVIDAFPVNEDILNDEELIRLSEMAIQKAEKEEDFSDIDNLINERVYQLYDFNSDEIAEINNYINERMEANARH